MMKHLFAALWLAAIVAVLSPAAVPAPVPTATAGGTLIAADPADPYRALAEEIAAAESVALVDTPAAALDLNPDYLLWVAAPGALSERALVEVGQALRARTSTVAVGIITGSTEAQARALWRRAGAVRSPALAAANAANDAAHVPARLLHWDGEWHALALDRPAFLDALSTAGYVTFTGHGSRTYLRLDETTTISAADLPELPPLVVGTASCQTLQPWTNRSIALAFVDRGAAAYAGFAYSPNEGYLFGEFDGLPFRYTWPGFTTGDVVQLQNRGTLQGFAAFPHYFMLGDPRIALTGAAPYRVAGDRIEGGARILTYTGAQAGILPLRIPGGAGYAFVEIPGVSAATDADPFYNARLQQANRGADKLVLFVHRGGDFQVRLAAAPPAGWGAVDVLVDSLDHTLIFAVTHGEAVGYIAAVPLWLAAVWRATRRRITARGVVTALLAGLMLAGLHALYMALRAGEVTITSKPLYFSAPGPVATGLLAWGGALLWQAAGTWRGRALAVLGATFPAWAAACLGLAAGLVPNLLFAQRGLGAGLYNYALGLAVLPALAVEVAVYLALFGAAAAAARTPAAVGARASPHVPA